MNAPGPYLDATWGEYTPGVPDALDPADTVFVRDADGVDDLIRTLSRPEVPAVRIHHHARDPVDHELVAGVLQGFGYLSWIDDEHDYVVAVGVPGSPEYVDHVHRFDAGDGLPMAPFRAALIEFLATAELPWTVAWFNELSMQEPRPARPV